MKESVLEEIGLTNSEIKVYLALLELGSSSTGKIVEKSDTASSKVYEILDKLMDKGLVSFIIKTGVKYFEAAAPERLMDYMNEKERDVDRQKAELKSIIPELEIKRNLSKYKSEATIYRGLKGLETAFYSAVNELNSGDKYYVIGIPQRSDQINRFFVKFSKYRKRKKIGQIALFNEAARGEPQTLPENLNEFDKIKFIPQVTPAAINIIKDKVIIFPEGTGEPLLFLIDSKEVAESFKVQFDHWWNQKVQTFEGQKDVENSMNNLIDKVKKEDEVMVFAAKPSVKNSADFNLSWNMNIRKKAKNVRLLYYGDNEINRKRSKELVEAGCETKIYPTQQTLPVSTIVAGHNILNLVWSKNPIAYQIDNKTVAESYKTNFELLWNQDTSVVKGMGALKESLYGMIDEMKSGEYYHVLGAAFGEKGYEKQYADFFKDFHVYRRKKEALAKFLFEQGTEHVLKRNKTYYDDTEIKYLPFKTDSPVAIFTQGDKTRLLIQKAEPIVMTINNKDVTQSFEKYFENLWNQDVTISKGWDSFLEKSIDIIDELNINESYDVIGAGYSGKELEEKFAKVYKKIHDKRIEKGIKTRLLFYQGNLPSIEKYKEDFYKGKKAEIKFLPYQTESPVEIIPHGNKTSLVIQEKEPTIITIDNEKITESFKKHFENLWNQDVKIYKGFEAATEKFYSMIDSQKKGEGYYVLGATYGSGNDRLIEWFKEYHKKRIEKGVYVDMLTVPKYTKKIIEIHKDAGDSNLEISHVKDAPQEFSSPMQINLYAPNKVLIYIWEKEFICFEIDSKVVYNNFKEYFDVLWNQETKVIKGLDAVQGLFEEMLNHGEVDLIGARGYFVDERPRFVDDWEKRAEKRGLKWRNIVDPEVKGHRITRWTFAETKYTIPKEYSTLSVFWIFGNKVCISNWMEKEPIVVIIENKNLYKVYKQQFEVMWNQDTTTYKGYDGFKTFFDKLLDEKDIWWIGGNFGIKRYFPEYWKEYRKKRIEKKSFWHDLLDPKLMADDSLKKDQYYESRILPRELTSPHVIAIYGYTVANIIWAGEQTTIFEFHNIESAQSYKKYFDHLWDQAKK
ncbi:MAG: helix-turn-helix domain-containing protein [Candidatus Woesearchaeota archaeon]